MAPPPDRVYFPPLEELLEGETVLLSWKLIASALASGDRLASKRVAEFVNDPFVLGLLRAPATAFAAPTPQTAAQLDTKTAAINVTPTPNNDRFDIQVLKADAAWLSKSTGIDEVSALRIVVVEHQTRAQAFLASPLSTQDATNIRKAAAGSSGGISVVASQGVTDAEALWTEFGTQNSRRRRLLATYLSERRYFAMTTDYVTSLILHGPQQADSSAAPDPAVETLRTDLIKGVLGDKEAATASSLSSKPLLATVGTYITELRACMKRAEEGIEAATKEAGEGVLTEDLAVEWVHTALTEAVHFMTVVFLVLQGAGSSFLPPSTTADWFRFVGDYSFFDRFSPDDNAVAELVLPLRTLACATSLILLNLNRAIGYLDHDLDIENDEEPYVSDANVLEAIHDAVIAAADEGLPTASPVYFSWSLILHRMEVSYQERAERRDLAQNQRAQDGFEQENNSHPLSFPHQLLQPRGRRSSVGSIVSIEAAKYDGFLSDKVLPFGEQGDSSLVTKLAMLATEQGRVYDVLSAMAICAGSGVDAVFRPHLGARIRVAFLELLKASFPIIGYQADPLSALLAVLAGGHELWNDTPTSYAADDNEAVATAVLQDSQLLQFYFTNALRRFPYEFTPFVSLCRYLASSASTDENLSSMVLSSLLETPGLTFSLPSGFEGYVMTELFDDDDQLLATMKTEEAIPLFPAASSRRRRLAYYNDDEDRPPVAVIPARTYGRFMIDGSGIVNLDYKHSTLALLGKQLDANLNEELYDPVLGFLPFSDTAEAINLLTALVRSEIRKATPKEQSSAPDGPSPAAIEAGLAILQEASRDLDDAKDIVSVVCDTLDTLIQDGPAETDESRMAVLSASMEFLATILPLCPGRIWSYMARCQLLNTEASAGRLCILTGASEVVAERFNFLVTSVRFLDGLISSAMTSSVQRKVHGKLGNSGGGSSSSSRALVSASASASDQNVWIGASDVTLAKVSLSVTQTVVDIYENTTTWKFASDAHRSSLVSGAVGILRDIVVYASSLETPAGSDSSSSQGLLGCLSPAAEFVVGSFLFSSSASSTLRFQPLLTSLLAGLSLPQSTLYSQRKVCAVTRVESVLEFVTALLKVASQVRSNSGLGEGGPTIETNIFQIASLPARLCASEAGLKQRALDLLTDLVVSAAAATANEPPSLLGYLGPQIARSFLGVLTTMDKPFQRPAETARVWKFFSTVLRHRQQWMANCLLTGKTPREALKSDGKISSGKLPTDSALAKAKDSLCSLAALPRVEAVAVLDFFAAAQNYWPWTIFAMGEGKPVGSQDGDDYLKSMRAYVRGLAPSSATAKNDAAAACGEARIAAYVAESLAMQLYHMRQMGSEAQLARDLLQDLDYYLRDGVTVGGYNASLHANFQRNFAKRYPGFTLEQFKRASSASSPSASLPSSSPLQSHDLGTQFYYALALADRMLSFDSAWGGVSSNSRGNNNSSSNKGFRYEMETANLNLSLVDAQIALFHAWEFLLLELSVCLLPSRNSRPPKEQTAAQQRLPVLMLQVAEQCLTSNQNNQNPEPVFLRIAQRRANLALLLLQRLAESVLLPKDVSPLLLTVWTSVNGVDNPWSAEQAPYYRTLLRILYVVLRGTKKAPAAVASEDAADALSSSSSAMVVSTTQTVLNVLDRVVAHGFRTQVSMIHDADAESRPEDVALLTAVLQACLSAPGVADQCQTQVLNIMATHDVLHVASSLFSWADKLTVDAGGGEKDPVYGELSLLFLLELSALPVVAEQLACDGFLGHLVTANLAAHHLRRPEVSPFAESAAAQRCYSMWAKAVLPLLLNLLIALGTSIAPEVAYVLNQFPNLLEASMQRFEAPGLSRTSVATRHGGRGGGGGGGHRDHMTLLAVNEIHSLALLTQVLAALRVNYAGSIPPVQWEAASVVLESVDFWLSRPKLLRERLVPLGARESEWRAMEPQWKGGLAENRLEEKVFSLLDAVRTILSEEEE